MARKIKNKEISNFSSEMKTDVLNFLHGDKRILFLTGEPGSGKSRLLDGIFHGGNNQGLLEKIVRYDLNSINMISNPFDFLDFFSETLDIQYRLKGFEKGLKIIDKIRRLHDRCNAIDEMENPVGLILVIDGLEKYPRLTNYLPPPNSWLRYLFSYRPQKILGFWQNQFSDLDTIVIDLKNGDPSSVSAIVRHENKSIYDNLMSKLKICSPDQAGMLNTALEVCDGKKIENCSSFEEVGILMSDKVKSYGLDTLKALSTLALCGFPVRLSYLTFIAGEGFSDDVFQSFSGVLKTVVNEHNETLYEMDNWLFRKILSENCQDQIENIVSEFEDVLISRKYADDSLFEEFCQKVKARWIWENLSKDEFYNGNNPNYSAFRFILGTSIAPYQAGLTSLAIEKNLAKNSRKDEDEKDLVSLFMHIEKIADSNNSEGRDIRAFFSKIQAYKVEDIVETMTNLSVLDDLRYYGLSFLSTLSLAVNPGCENCEKKISALFREIFSRLSEGIGDWRFYFSNKFMAYWTCELLKTQEPEDIWKMLTIGAIEAVEKDKLAIRVLDELISTKNSETAITLAEKLFDAEEKAKKISEIALLIAKTGDPSDALKIIMSNENIKNKPMILSIIAKKKSSMGLFEESESLAEGIEDLNEKFSALSFIAISYAEMISKGGKNTSSLNRAMRIVDEIKDVYLKNKTTAEIAVKISASRLEEGLRILERIPADDHEMRSYAMSEISKILCLENKSDKALEIAEAMPDNIYRSAALSYIAKNLYQKGAKERAYEIADKITFFGLKFQTLFQMSKDLSSTIEDDRHEISAFDKTSDEEYVVERKFIHALGEGDGKSALECVENFRERTDKIGLILKAINESQGIPTEKKRGFYRALNMILSKVNPEKSLYVRILSLIACEEAKSGDVLPVISEMAEKLSENDLISDKSKNMELMGEISKHLVVSLNKAMTSQYVEKPDEYNEKTKMMESVLKILIDNSRESTVYDITDGLSDNSTKSEIRTEIALHYLLNGKKNEALELVKKIENDIERDDSISMLSEKIALIAEHDEAGVIIEEISQPWLKKDTVSQISVKFAERRDYQNAMFYAAKTDDLLTQALLFCKIALYARRDGNIQDYENIFGRALDKIKNFSDEKLKSRALSEIASNLLKYNLFDRALEISESVSDPFEKFQSYATLEKYLYEKGHREKASEFLKHIYGLLNSLENCEEKSEAFISIVPSLIKRGEQDSAEKICSEIIDHDKKSRLLALIAIEKMKKSNERDFARILVKAFEAIDKIQNKERRLKTLEDIFLMCFVENSSEGLEFFLKTFYMNPEMREDSVKALNRTMMSSPLESRRDSLSLLDFYYRTYPILATKYCVLSLIDSGNLALATEIIESIPK